MALGLLVALRKAKAPEGLEAGPGSKEACEGLCLVRTAGPREAPERPNAHLEAPDLEAPGNRAAPRSERLLESRAPLP